MHRSPISASDAWPDGYASVEFWVPEGAPERLPGGGGGQGRRPASTIATST